MWWKAARRREGFEQRKLARSKPSETTVDFYPVHYEAGKRKAQLGTDIHN